MKRHWLILLMILLVAQHIGFFLTIYYQHRSILAVAVQNRELLKAHHAEAQTAIGQLADIHSRLSEIEAQVRQNLSRVEELELETK